MTEKFCSADIGIITFYNFLFAQKAISVQSENLLVFPVDLILALNIGQNLLTEISSSFHFFFMQEAHDVSETFNISLFSKLVLRSKTKKT